MRAIVVGVFALAVLLFGGAAVSAESGQGNERAVERRGFETPPGQGVKDKALKDQAVPVPDSGSTLTLLSLAIGGALLLRGWTSRRTQPNG
jgi:VPDSG-CTERM motif